MSTTLECRLLHASIACYAIKDGALDKTNPDLVALELKSPDAYSVFVNGLESINAGFVAETADDWVVLALRGTLPPFKGDIIAWILDWLQDFELGPTEWTANGKPFGRVETGFATALESVWDQIERILGGIDMSAKKGIFVTGHSKGAAMTFLAASRLKSAAPDRLVEVCCFAAPMTCDATFEAKYDALGLRPFTVRYQNRYDIIPYLPWWPTLLLAANAERMSGASEVLRLAREVWPETGDPESDNLYKPIGILRYLANGCVVEYGEQGADDAWSAMKYALEHLEVGTIAEAHHAAGRYLTCVCEECGTPTG